MTVHKSQGSEFDRVLFILPDRDAPVLSRELLYTGLTRARAQVELWWTEPVFREAVARRAERNSGLRGSSLLSNSEVGAPAPGAIVPFQRVKLRRPAPSATPEHKRLTPARPLLINSAI